MSEPNFTTVDPAMLHQHAIHVDDIAGEVGSALGAAEDVTPGGWDLAYGVIFQFYSVHLRLAAGIAIDATRKTQELLITTADGLHKAAGEYDNTEQGHKLLLDTIYHKAAGVLPSTLGIGELVDKKAKFDPGTYGIDRNEVIGGDSTSINLFTRGTGDNWFAGSGFLDDTQELVKSVSSEKDRNLAVAQAQLGAISADALSAATDPIGTAGAWLTGWLLEHFKPLRVQLDGITGIPDMIKGVAATWNNIAQHWETVAKNYAGHVTKDTSGWQGAAGDAYRKNRASKLVEATAGMAQLAKVMSILVGVAGEIVDTLRGLIRDRIADLVGEAAKMALKSVGIGVPNDFLGEIARTLRTNEREIKAVQMLLQDLATQVTHTAALYKTAAKIVPLLNG